MSGIPLYKIKGEPFTNKDYRRVSRRKFQDGTRIQVLASNRSNINLPFRSALLVELKGKQPIMIYGTESEITGFLQQLDRNPQRLLNKIVLEGPSTEYALTKTNVPRRTGPQPRLERLTERLYDKSAEKPVLTKAQEKNKLFNTPTDNQNKEGAKDAFKTE